MLNLNDVALFVQVVGVGSFAGAARRLGMPPNTVSRRIQELEAHLGVRLMQRSTRKLNLTDAGRRFYDRCSAEIESLTRSAQDLSEDGQTPSGSIRVAAPADFFSSFMMEWIAEFLAAYPRVRIEFHLDDARVDLISNGIDVAFRAGKMLEPNLVARQVGTTRNTLMASPAYLAAHGRPETLEALSRHDCITLKTQAGRSSWQLDGPDGPVEIAVEGRFSANTMQTLIKAALAGLGIALLPAILTKPEVRAGRLQGVLPEYGGVETGFYFVYVSRKQQPKAVKAFIDFASRRIQERDLLEEPNKRRADGRAGRRFA